LPGHTSPCTNAVPPAGRRRSVISRSASSSRGVVGIRPVRRLRAKSSTAIGRGRKGRGSVAVIGMACAAAREAPTVRSRSADGGAGHAVEPATTVSSVVTPPVWSPSRSALIRRGACSPYRSAASGAAAQVAIVNGPTRGGARPLRTASVTPPACSIRSSHGPSRPCSGRTSVTLAPEPIAAAAQISMRSVATAASSPALCQRAESVASSR
jgi:hypothetical protein